MAKFVKNTVLIERERPGIDLEIRIPAGWADALGSLITIDFSHDSIVLRRAV